jgi:hypothetical protein
MAQQGLAGSVLPIYSFEKEASDMNITRTGDQQDKESTTSDEENGGAVSTTGGGMEPNASGSGTGPSLPFSRPVEEPQS